VAWASAASDADTSPLVEEFSFTMKDYKMNHHSDVINLNLSIRYRYVAGLGDEDYPDFRLLYRDVEEFLTGYPNERDYWEIVNKKLTLLLLRKYPALSSITCEMQVSPSQREPFIRSSTVTRKRSGLHTGNGVAPRRRR
jgi:hypothetical protein